MLLEEQPREIQCQNQGQYNCLARGEVASFDATHVIMVLLSEEPQHDRALLEDSIREE